MSFLFLSGFFYFFVQGQEIAFTLPPSKTQISPLCDATFFFLFFFHTDWLDNNSELLILFTRRPTHYTIIMLLFPSFLPSPRPRVPPPSPSPHFSPTLWSMQVPPFFYWHHMVELFWYVLTLFFGRDAVCVCSGSSLSSVSTSTLPHPLAIP